MRTTVITTQEWGARPPKVQPKLTTPRYIVIHHTGVAPSSNGTLPGAEALARSIQAYHMDHNGWIDSGQNFLISEAGFVLEGRTGSLAAIEMGRCVQSAHTVGANDSPGIENEGNFMQADMPSAQWDALVKLCADICQLCHLPPSRIKGHRDFNSTKCPGARLYRRLAQLKAEVSQLLKISA